MNNEPDAAKMFVDEFMTDPGGKTLVSMKLRMMLSHSSTNREHLAEALLIIGQSFRGNDDKIIEGVDRLYKGFVARVS